MAQRRISPDYALRKLSDPFYVEHQPSDFWIDREGWLFSGGSPGRGRSPYGAGFVPPAAIPLGTPALPAPGSPGPARIAEPRAILPSLLQQSVPGGQLPLLGLPGGPAPMMVRVDPNNPGRYIVTTDDGREYPNSSKSFVDSLGLHVPDDPTIIREDDMAGFDLGDVLTDVARTMLPRWIEEAVGITEPGAGLVPPVRPPVVPIGGYTVPQPDPRGTGPFIPAGGVPGPRGHVFRNGRWVRIRRRRRRKLLTEGDFNSLLKIQTLKNTDNIKIALSKALR